MDRQPVVRASGQGLVPVLVDGGRAIADSTAILLHLEERYPDPPLVPTRPGARAECLVLEDWADQAFMAMSRRIAYRNVLSPPGPLASMFFPGDAGRRRWLKERIARRRRRPAVRAEPRAPRPGRRRGEAPGGPGHRAARRTAAGSGGRARRSPTSPWRRCRRRWPPTATLCDDPAVRALLAWGEALVPADVMALYRG